MSARILIVEDEALVALELRFQLEGMGYGVAGVAADAATARNLAAQEVVDLALVDLNLADGPTGMALGRELAGDHDVAVVYLTGNPDLLRDEVAGAIGVLCKPADEAVVEAAVDFALRRRRGDRSIPAPPAMRLFG